MVNVEKWFCSNVNSLSVINSLLIICRNNKEKQISSFFGVLLQIVSGKRCSFSNQTVSCKIM